MKTSALIAIASLSVLASVGARADEADASQYVLKFDSSRARAEVMAEARAEARADKSVPASSKVAPRVNSSIERTAVRAEAAQALRNGLISRGEAA
jgi:hypothetical protein